MTLEPAVKNLLIEIVAGSMVSDQIEALGQMLIPRLDIHELSGRQKSFTLSPRFAAQVLVEHLSEKKLLMDFIKLLVEMDEESVFGKELRIEGLAHFLQRLTESGLFYDTKKCRVVPVKDDLMERPDWGSLKNNRNYSVTVISMDVVGSSELVRKFGQKTMEKFYSFFWRYLKERLASYNGRIWSWAGDGGLLAFAFKNHQYRAIRFALEMQRVMPLMNTHIHNPIEENVSTRISVNSGKVVFMADTGKIISDVINLVAHLEKRGTQPGFVTTTEETWSHLPPKIQIFFDPMGDFEGILYFSTRARMDMI